MSDDYSKEKELDEWIRKREQYFSEVDEKIERKKISRVYPESKTALIKWIEDHFHEIDEFIIQITMKDNTSMMIYDTYKYMNALGMLEMAKDSVHEMAKNNEFICKK